MRENIDMKAKEVAAEVRNFVRDRFTPGSIDSLDQLSEFVQSKVREVAIELRGSFNCAGCGTGVDVESVRCRHCSDPTNGQHA